MKPIKGYIPKKQIEESNPSGNIVAGAAFGVAKLYKDMKDLQRDVVSEISDKIEEIDSTMEVLKETAATTIENLNTAVEEKSKLFDEAITHLVETSDEARAVIENTKNEALRLISESRGPKGDDGINPDQNLIIDAVIKQIPQIDEKKLLKKFMQAIPDRKADLKIIQESIEIDPMSVIDRIMELPEEKLSKLKIKSGNVDGLEQTIRAFHNQLGRGYIHGGGISNITGLIQQGTNVTITGSGTTADPYIINSTGSTGITSISVVTANGLAGSSSGGATPALTLSTTVTGIVKGNGTALSAATAGTDYQAPISLTTTGTGAATFVANVLNIPTPTATGTVTSVNGTSTGSTLTASGGPVTTTGSLNFELNLSHANTWLAAQRGAFVQLTDASTIAIDAALANNFYVALGGNRTLGVPTNLVEGQSGVIDVYQDITGSRTLAYSWCYQFAGGTSPTLSTAKLVVDQLVYMVNRSKTSTVTITNASPAVFTWTAHGLISGDRIQLTTTGALPTGLTASTTYWVTVIDANTFKVSSSLANAQAATFINTSSSGSGTHTATCLSVTISLPNAALA